MSGTSLTCPSYHQTSLTCASIHLPLGWANLLLGGTASPSLLRHFFLSFSLSFIFSLSLPSQASSQRDVYTGPFNSSLLLTHLSVSGTWLLSPWPDGTVLTTLLMAAGLSHPKGCFPGLHVLDPEAAGDCVNHTLLRTVLLPGVQDTFYFCSFLTSTLAPAGVSNTHPWGLALGSALRGLPTLCPLPGAPLLPNGFSSSLHVHNSPGFLFQKTLEQICQGKYHISHIYNFNFSSSHILKEVTGKILIITIFNPHIQNITSSTCNQYKVMNKILHSPFPTKSSKFVLYTYSRSQFGLTTFQVHNSHMWLVPSYHIGWYRSRFWFPAVWNLEVPRREYVQNTGLFKGGAIWVWL